MGITSCGVPHDTPDEALHTCNNVLHVQVCEIHKFTRVAISMIEVSEESTRALHVPFCSAPELHHQSVQSQEEQEGLGRHLGQDPWQWFTNSIYFEGF